MELLVILHSKSVQKMLSYRSVQREFLKEYAC